MNILDIKPYKGTSDFLPEAWKVQKYMFETWAQVCTRFGYKEYQTPLLEPVDIYKAKSGVLKEELFVLKDRADRELALRPEMTPSVTRLVVSEYKREPKPIRWFSIGSFYRNEAPQKGRTREFWQLNADIFGDESLNSDAEVLTLAIETMLAFGAPDNSFKVYVNYKPDIENFIEQDLKLTGEAKTQLARVIDKKEKVSATDFTNMLAEFLTQEQITSVKAYFSQNTGSDYITTLMQQLSWLGYDKYVEYKPSLIRGLDYYDGLVFEVYDLEPTSNRSLFGGGRYNGLAQIFGAQQFPAVGFAIGNETMRIFLENWQLLPKLQPDSTYLVTLWPSYAEASEGKPAEVSKYLENSTKVAQKLRGEGKTVELWLDSETNLSNQLKYASKKGFRYVVIIGEEEIAKNMFTIKDLESGEQTQTTLS